LPVCAIKETGREYDRPGSQETLELLFIADGRLYRPSAAYQLNDQYDQSDNQKNVNKITDCGAGKAEPEGP
jgi:hypothetical protein